MNVVEQFLGQGVLPFVGREGEIERILDFWRGTVDSQRLRLLLLTAEAGAGKSRLLEESVAMIENDGGVVIHAKLYPEGTNDLTSLLTQALQRKKKDQRVPGIRAAEEVKGIVPSLQRLSRLRPLLLVIEDLHLMPEEALPDLTTLLSQLADETISVLGCARPVQMQARSRLESFLVDTLEMKGLSPNAIAKLWKELFADEPKNWVPSALHKATFGNPLALRSAIRALIHGRGVEQRSASQIWKLNISQQEFEGLVHQSVSLVVEGLVAQLTPELRQKAARLAMLGEVFARESAEYLLGSTEALDQLQATGLLLLSGYPASSLAGYIPDAPRFNSDGSYPGSRSPLIAFTHSLLHNYLVAEVEGDAVALCELLSRNLPLYSLVPLRLLRSVQIAEEISGDVLSNSFQRVIIVAQRFDRTSNWKEGHNVWETARHLLSFLKERIPPEEYHYINVVFLTVQLSIWRRERGSKRWLDTLEKGIEATENYSREWEAYARILLWAYWGEYYGRVDYQNTFTAEKNAREVLERFPDQKYRPSWVYHLEMLTLIALQVDDEERIADMQQEFDTFLADPTLPPEIRSSLIQRLAKFFLMYFSTQEELAERVASLELIEEEVDELSPFFGTSKSYFLLSIGRFAEAEELARRLITISYDLGEWGTTLTAASVRAMAAVATGASIEFAAKELKEGIELVEQNKSVGGMTIAANAFLHILLFLGIERPEQALRQLFDLSIDQLTNQQLALIGIWNHDLESASILLKEDHINQLYLKGERVKVWKDLLDPETPLSFEGLDRLMKREILELRDILSVQGSIHLWLAMQISEEDRSAFLPTALDVLERSLEWLAQHQAWSYTTPLIRLLEKFEGVEQGKRWRAIVADAEKLRSEREGEGKEEEGSIRISMLGTIRVALPGEDFVPLRGVRIRTLLGLMVADCILSRPLSPEEFLRLAGGDDPDLEHARKKKNMGVVRLREILGREAILTDEETPRLHADIVTVDLIRANELLSEVGGAIREGALVRAQPLVEEALEIIGGEVPFPTLYDDFFEAVREDFEHRLRRGLLEVARGLLAEGEASRAETLLRRAFDLLSGDEEIGETLRQALIASGNRVEAARVKMAMTP